MGSRLDGKPSPICVQYPDLLRSLEVSLFFFGRLDRMVLKLRELRVSTTRMYHPFEG